MSHIGTKLTRKLLAATVGVVASLAALGHILPAEATAVRHLTLDHALPGPDSVVSAGVSEVRLFFSEPPQMRATSIRVVDAGRSLMTSTPPSAYEGDERQVYISMEAPLPPGSYVVQWRVMAQDGHVQRGDFSFRVDAE